MVSVQRKTLRRKCILAKVHNSEKSIGESTISEDTRRRKNETANVRISENLYRERHFVENFQKTPRLFTDTSDSACWVHICTHRYFSFFPTHLLIHPFLSFASRVHRPSHTTLAFSGTHVKICIFSSCSYKSSPCLSLWHFIRSLVLFSLGISFRLVMPDGFFLSFSFVLYGDILLSFVTLYRCFPVLGIFHP
jgi:hypothetical protein